MPTTPLQGLPYPSGSATNQPQVDIQALAVAVEQLLVQKYADSTARGSAVTSPVAGMMSWLSSLARYSYNADGTTGGWKDLGQLVGVKLIGIDTGIAGTGSGVGGVTNCAPRTIASPFGSGVPYMVVVISSVLFDNSSGAAGALEIRSPQLGTIVRRGGIGGGTRQSTTVVDVQTVPGGGSISYSTSITLTAGTATWYADATNNYTIYLAVPLSQ